MFNSNLCWVPITGNVPFEAGLLQSSSTLYKEWNKLNKFYGTGEARSKSNITQRICETTYRREQLSSKIILSSGHSGTEKGPEREQRRWCSHLPLPTRWSRRVRQSSASLWEAGTSGAGKGMAVKQAHNCPQTRTLAHTTSFTDAKNSKQSQNHARLQVENQKSRILW